MTDYALESRERLVFRRVAEIGNVLNEDNREILQALFVSAVQTRVVEGPDSLDGGDKFGQRDSAGDFQELGMCLGAVTVIELATHTT